MACPYFMPEVLSQLMMAARAPLGGVFEGSCSAGAVATRPPIENLEQCNFGYGRGRCSLFPEGAAADAVRFTDYQGELLYVLEREYTPIEHGKAETLDPGTVLGRQAAAFSGARPR